MVCRQQPAGLSELVEHTYVLRPIDGRMTYLRRGPQARSQPDDAVQQADLSLQTVSMHMARTPSLSRAWCIVPGLSTHGSKTLQSWP